MPNSELSLIAHLMRRAGFSARRDELENFSSKSYAEVVDELLRPEDFPDLEEDIMERYNHGRPRQGHWMFRMVNSNRPLVEKMSLFWHYIFATGNFKSDNPQASEAQVDMFREVCLSDMRIILVALSKDPAMLFWLDNNENLKDEPNENYGRELLELFSMGVGNYTEDDVKGATMAFTGWSFRTNIPGKIYPSQFLYLKNEHADGVKSFLGETGNLNGEDIVDVIVKQPATARFVCRHLYDFFVSDEPPVAAWNETPPQNPEAIDELVSAYFQSGGEMRSVLRVLFNADFFKESRFRKVKSPVELVTGVVKLTGTARFPDARNSAYLAGTGAMGQNLMNPLTVEGWHTGQEWIDGGTLNARVNFAVDAVSDPDTPGLKDLLARLGAVNRPVSPEEFVEVCLDYAGPLLVGDKTKEGLLKYAIESGGELSLNTDEEMRSGSARVSRMLQLIVSAKEYQFG